MDEINATNRARWNALANANIEWSRPFLEFTPEQAAEHIYRHGVLKDVSGKQVPCGWRRWAGFSSFCWERRSPYWTSPMCSWNGTARPPPITA
jgi:hypothetical protein